MIWGVSEAKLLVRVTGFGRKTFAPALIYAAAKHGTCTEKLI